MKSVQVKIKTLTPIYTGGTDNRSEQIHATGIMGSLRWWYEAILRGYGLRACDPTSHSCIYDSSKEKSIKEQLCSACQIFGATGYARRFSLEVIPQDFPAWERSAREPALNLRPYDRTRGWFFNSGRVGSEELILTGENAAVDQMVGLLKFMEKYSSIGAKPQHGYGLFKIENIKDEQPKKLTSFVETPGSHFISDLPDLRTFTFFKFRFSPQNPNWWTQVSGIKELRTRRDDWAIVEKQAANGMVPVSPALKNYLRYGHDWPGSIAFWLFGTMSGKDKIRSKISFSWAYRDGAVWEVRGWVYLPQDQTGRAFYNYADNLRQLRTILEDPQNWICALGLEPSFNLQSEVTIEPKHTAWTPRTTTDIKSFLDQALRERN